MYLIKQMKANTEASSDQTDGTHRCTKYHVANYSMYYLHITLQGLQLETYHSGTRWNATLPLTAR